MSQLVFGADGGGTKTHGIISDPQGAILARRSVGASNPNVVGFETAARHLFDLVSQCCADLSCSPSDLKVILFGLSGAGSEESRTRLQTGVRALAGHALPIVIETDARIALEGAFDGAPGAIIIAGTGSVVIGKNARNEIVRVGGWGRGLSDEGSGFFLGLEALKSLRLHYDGRGGSPLLATLIADEFGLNSRARIITAVHQEKFEPSKVAPFVLRAAEEHDAVGLRILNAGADELADQARALVERLDVSGKVGIAFFGGLIENRNVYSEMLKAKIAALIPHAEVRVPARSPAEGAVLMALDYVRKQ